jgi:hypothetical protein
MARKSGPNFRAWGEDFRKFFARQLKLPQAAAGSRRDFAAIPPLVIAGKPVLDVVR